MRIAVILLFLAAATLSWCAQSKASQMLLIMPFENSSDAPGLDWIGEAFPEVLSTRLNSGPLFIISREDRLNAFDRMGIPVSARPSRATVYEVAQAMDADYVLMGNFQYDGKNLITHAHIMDLGRLRLGPELKESGPLTSLIKIQTALAWDVLNEMHLSSTMDKSQWTAQWAPIRLDALENYVRGVIAGSDQEKITRFKKAAELDPANMLAWLQLGKAYYRARDYQSAISSLAKVAKDDASANEAQFYLGLSAFYANQMEKAEAAFRGLATRLPLTEVYNNLGVVASRQGNRDAHAYFERTIEVDPTDPDYHFNLAVELNHEGDKDGAVRELRAVLALHSDSEARGFLDSLIAGVQPPRLPLERIKRDYDESGFRQLALEIENADEARLKTATPEEHAAFHVQRGQALLEQGVMGEAEKQFHEAVLLDPASAAAHAGMARALEAEQDTDGARNEALAALRLKPLAEAYLVLARLDLGDNNFQAAERNLDHALALDPANPAAVAIKHDLEASKSKLAQ